jgi:acid phosphatase (class A)
VRAEDANPIYLQPGQVDVIALLPPPPAPGSEQQRHDLQAVLEAQRLARKGGSDARAIGDAEASCARFAGALGDNLDPAMAITALTFATRVARQAAAVTGAPKAYWQRDRPYVTSALVRRRADIAAGAGLSADARQQRDHTSYPSGHAAFGAACAIVLARMVPEHRADLFARAGSYAASRVIVGAHYPSDVEAGRLAGTVAMAQILQNPCFADDLAAARASLRHALGLPDAEPHAPGVAPGLPTGAMSPPVVP